MSQDCPHDRCNFFLTNGDAPCPACGRQAQRRSSQTWFAVGVAGLFGVLLVAMGGAGWWLLGLPLLLIAGVGGGLLVLQLAMTPRFVTLDARYQQAVDESAHWLTKWIELYRLNAQAADYLDDEQRLVEEAKAAAGDAAAEATTRRGEYAARYIDNAFERLDSLSPQDHAWTEAVAIIAHYLDTLWLDQATANDARNRLAEHASVRRRSDLVAVASTVRLFEGPEAQAELPSASSDLVAQRSRLRIERQLLRDAPGGDTGG